MTTDHKKYSAFLIKRSLLGYLYRRAMLYPKLCGYLKGELLVIGCGTGYKIQSRSQFTGVDINPFNVKICKSRGLDAKVMNIHVVPFSSYSFDGFLLENVLEHIYCPRALLREAYRVFRPDGVVLVSIPCFKRVNLWPEL